ncbi:MAG: small basic protein [Candidatus Omnitrophica bacterium]|nr:small basic protein [Candidatus Omnitrophota bacterium]
MTIHPSLRISEADKKVRSVLKRPERIRAMIEKDHWKEGDSIFGLPKMKIVKIKVGKKEKAAPKAEEGAAGAEGKAAPAAEAKKETKK